MVLAVRFPSPHALRVAERDPDVSLERSLGGLDEVVLGFEGVQELDLEFLGPSAGLFLVERALARGQGLDLDGERAGQCGDGIVVHFVRVVFHGLVNEADGFGRVETGRVVQDLVGVHDLRIDHGPEFVFVLRGFRISGGVIVVECEIISHGIDSFSRD